MIPLTLFLLACGAIYLGTIQAAFNALAGWVPALLLSILLYYLIGRLALLPLHMTANRNASR